MPPDREQIERYLNPPFDTAFPLEYAFWMLGDDIDRIEDGHLVLYQPILLQGKKECFSFQGKS